MTNQQKEVWTLRTYWDTEGNGDVYETKDLIVYNKKQVEEYIQDNFNAQFLKDAIDYSDGEDNITLSYSAIYDENQNEVKHDIERCFEEEDHSQIKEGFYEQTDTIEATKDYTLVTDSQIEELKARFNPHVVVDLTENE